jgi:hypothetical protein
MPKPKNMSAREFVEGLNRSATALSWARAPMASLSTLSGSQRSQSRRAASSNTSPGLTGRSPPPAVPLCSIAPPDRQTGRGGAVVLHPK